MATLVYQSVGLELSEYGIDAAQAMLGAYMSAWSDLEVMCSRAFADSSGISNEVASIIFDRVGTREQIEILGELVKRDARLDPVLHTLESGLQGCSIKRNKIVHASWGLYNGGLARFWNGLTRANLADISSETSKGQSLRAKNIHLIEDIDLERHQCLAMAANVEQVSDAITRHQAKAERAQIEELKQRAWPERYRAPFVPERDPESDR